MGQPSFGVTLTEIKSHIKGKVSVSPKSTLVLDGDIDLYNVDLDGALIIKSVPGSKVTIKNLTVKNEGWGFKEIDPDDESVDQRYRIRGYVPDRTAGALELNFPVPGQYVVDDTTSLRTILV